MLWWINDRGIFQSVTQAYLENKNWNSPNRSQTFDLLITSSVVLRLSDLTCLKSLPLYITQEGRLITATVLQNQLDDQ